MMFNTLGIHDRGFLRDAEFEEEAGYNVVPFAAPVGQFSSLIGEEYGTVGLGVNQPRIFQSTDRFRHRDVRDAQSLGHINGTSLPLLFDQIVNQFDVVFRQFALVAAPRVRVCV